MWYRSFEQPRELDSLNNGLQAEQMQASCRLLNDRRTDAARLANLAVDVRFSTYLPENFTERYAYPLIAYVHDRDRYEADLGQWFPAISDQNFIALGIRAPFPHRLGFPGQCHWKLKRPDASLATIRDSIQAAQIDFNIHPDRITLLGEGEGAIVSLQQLILQNSREYDLCRVTGVICSKLPKGWTKLLPLFRGSLEGRLLILDEVKDALGQAALDALGHAGVEVTVYSPEAKRDPAQMINHWVMAGLNTAIF